MRTHNLVLSRNMKNISFLSEIFKFLQAKFSVHSYRGVFVMDSSKVVVPVVFVLCGILWLLIEGFFFFFFLFSPV